MHNGRLSLSLLSELYDLEEDAYRLSLREVKRMSDCSPRTTLRLVMALTFETLDEELPAIARERGVDLGSARSLALDTIRRMRERVIDRIVDHEHAYRRVLTALHRGIDLMRIIHAAAIDEHDEPLSVWAHRWLDARERLVTSVSNELVWFGRHPMLDLAA